MRRVGLLGGTFDPIHVGHLRPAVEIRAALDLEHIRLIPARHSPLRDHPGATGADRLAMVRAAVDGEDDLIADGREIGRAGPSYTVETLSELRAELPDALLFFIMGADAFADFERWHQWRGILERAHLIVARRPDAELTVPAALTGALTDNPDELTRSRAGRVWVQAVTQLDISATGIRRAAAAGADLRYLLPEGARRHLEAHRLYRPSSDKPDPGNT